MQFFFHLIKVANGIALAHENFFFLTGFARRKYCLWKNRGLDLEFTPYDADSTESACLIFPPLNLFAPQNRQISTVMVRLPG
jgi:hypothetical protein